MTWYTFVNTNNISFKYSSFQNFSENSFKTKTTFFQNHSLSYHETTFRISFMVCPFHIIFCLILKKKDIQTYRNMSNLTGKNQAGPTMFLAYRSENPVKTCSLLRSGNNFLFVGLSNGVFKCRSFLQYRVYFFK